MYKNVDDTFILQIKREDLVGKIDAKCNERGEVTLLKPCVDWKKDRVGIIRDAAEDVKPEHIGLILKNFRWNTTPVNRDQDVGGTAIFVYSCLWICFKGTHYRRNILRVDPLNRGSTL